MKHKIKNIANRPIPVDGTDLIPEPGEIVEAEITSNLEAKIKNKFFEDLGESKHNINKSEDENIDKKKAQYPESTQEENEEQNTDQAELESKRGYANAPRKGRYKKRRTR